MESSSVFVSKVYISELSELKFSLQPICILPGSNVNVMIVDVMLLVLSRMKSRVKHSSGCAYTSLHWIVEEKETSWIMIIDRSKINLIRKFFI